MDRAQLEQALSELPLYVYEFLTPADLEFSDRIRWICQHECPMYGQSWACPPGVGTVECCKGKCFSYQNCLMIATITEVSDISDITETLATRPEHEAITNQVRDLMRQQGVDPYILSTEACAECDRCAILDGQPCRLPDRMHPCVESHGINILGLLEDRGLSFQYGENVVTWFSLLFFEWNDKLVFSEMMFVPKAPSDEGAVTPNGVTGGEKILQIQELLDQSCQFYLSLSQLR